MSATQPILIVDDDELLGEFYRSILEEAGYDHVDIITDSRLVMEHVGSRRPVLTLLDLNMPHISGEELLEELAHSYPEVAIIVLTAVDRVETAVRCMKVGAFDYMTKPVDENRLATAVRNALLLRQLQDEVVILSSPSDERPLSKPEAFASILTVSPALGRIFRYVEAVARSPKAVLVTGESGTGKELVARAIHDAGDRRGRFIAVNVSGLDDTVFSDTLFGHRRGAFTGADTDRKGLIESAADGTLFLDEIGDLQIASQIKLLRLLQEGEYYPLGSDVPAVSRARIVAATNVDLKKAEADGTFRKDLYYRLRAHHVEIPPLRDRPDDLPILVGHFVAEAARLLGKKVPTVPKELVPLLRSYSWPGNVRELQSIITDAVSRHEGGMLTLSVFREYVGAQRRDSGEPDGRRFSWTGDFPRLKEVEDFLIAEALRRADGNQTVAAGLLGISQSTLSRRARDA